MKTLFYDTGEEGTIGNKFQRDQVRRNGPNEQRQRGGHEDSQRQKGTRRPTTCTHAIITKAAIVFDFRGFLQGSSTTCYLRKRFFLGLVEL